MSGVQIESLQAEHHESGLGLDNPTPRLSWRYNNPSGIKDWTQSAYEITIHQGGRSTTEQLDSDENVLVPWLGEPLTSRERVRVEVRAKGADGTWTERREINLEAGLLEKSDWKAKVAGGPKIGGERGPLRPVRVWGKMEWDGKGTNARYVPPTLT
jgi:alpha-L-rhamnosidase